MNKLKVMETEKLSNEELIMLALHELLRKTETLGAKQLMQQINWRISSKGLNQ